MFDVKLPSFVRDLLVLMLGASLGFALLLGALPSFGLPEASLLVQTLLILTATLTIGLLIVDALIREHEAPVDIWGLHRQLMKASNQKLPTTPTMCPGLLLYYALTLEELAEAGDAIHQVLEDNRPRSPAAVYQHRLLSNAIRESSSAAADWATSIRDHLALIPSEAITYPIPHEAAVTIFDGVIDTTVTAAGLALAGGFPGPQGYLEVATSNLSKRNPATGMIDRDPSGKWLKGPEFFRPDLSGVLNRHVVTADFAPSTLATPLGR